jgi:DNA-binding transcriptional LysR family regulator
VKSAERVGTHYVFIGEVQEIFVSSGGNPLIFANRAYGSPAKIAPVRAVKGGAEALRIGSLHTFGPYILPGILARLEQAGGPVALDLQEGDQKRQLDLLRSGEIDIALMYDFGLADDLASQVLTSLETYVLLPEGHPLAERDKVALQDLLPLRLVLLDAPPSRDFILSLFKGIGEPLIGYRAQSVEMVRGMVGHGLGYGLMTTKPASAMSYDGKALVARPLAGEPVVSRLVLTWRKDVPLSKAAEAFLWNCNEIFGLDLD